MSVSFSDHGGMDAEVMQCTSEELLDLCPSGSNPIPDTGYGSGDPWIVLPAAGKGALVLEYYIDGVKQSTHPLKLKDISGAVNLRTQFSIPDDVGGTEYRFDFNLGGQVPDNTFIGVGDQGVKVSGGGNVDVVFKSPWTGHCSCE